MSHGIYTATAGAVARQNHMDVVANNLANSNTSGYRRMRVSFEEVLTRATSDQRHIVAVSQGSLSNEQGPMINTDNPMDLAIQGDGFFLVEDRGQNLGLVRSLSAHIDSYGRMVDSRNRVILSRSGGPIEIDPTKSVEISAGGEVMQGNRVVDLVSLVNVPEPRFLEPASHGTYRPSATSGELYSVAGDVVSGSLEGSNVQPVQSMVELIQLQRDFESLMKGIKSFREADERLTQAIQGG
jgi:flagellar basal body rod protein FlgG